MVMDKKRRKTVSYCERGFAWGLPRMKPLTHICQKCHFTMKRNGTDCPSCHTKGVIVCVGLTARPPKKGQHKKWKQFWKLFGKGSHPKGCR